MEQPFVVLLSVPHTGTRFTMAFLDAIGAKYRNYHSTMRAYDDIRNETNMTQRVIIPVRDPLLCFTSTFMRNGHVENVMRHVEVSYTFLKFMETWFQRIEYLRLDTDNRDAELLKIADFCGIERDYKFQWETIGSMWEKKGSPKPDATDYAAWEIVSNKFFPEKKDEILKMLKPYRQYYGF